ncbi:mechanosensitive ion channel family protein [uncultured Alistipes sp.]|jgi:transmembrane ion channel|uniref:mechanosensitive ion channel family protein n=1 Tax=uncultured Alistipes sp. TaxID=538949 RepID=UPI0025D4DB77|nr:mechanosensitive ion channel family protein [uncultured Alistipes sp.]
MDSERLLHVVLFISKVTRYILYILLLYLTVPLLFSVFPPTQRFAETLFGWILTPLSAILKGFVKYLPNLFKIIIIVVIMRYIVKFFRYIAREISTGKLVIPGFYADWAKATFNILRIFLYAFMLILIFPLLPGSDSGIFQGVSVFIGVLFTLGSTTVVGNLMAGMVITYMRPFVIGDRIRIGEIMGDVIEKSPFVIRVKTVKNEIITVPNATILSSNVINYSYTSTVQNDGLIINTTVTMGYDVPWRQVNQLLIDAALKTDLVLQDPQPFVLQTALNDFAASYQLNAYTRHPEKQAAIYSHLHQNIQDIFAGAGIEMVVPNYQSVRDGNKSTVPPRTDDKKA